MSGRMGESYGVPFERHGELLVELFFHGAMGDVYRVRAATSFCMHLGRPVTAEDVESLGPDPHDPHAHVFRYVGDR